MSSKALEIFYENRDIFITGGTGYIGKSIIEKILRSFNVNRIYVLMRSKKGKSLLERTEVLRNDVIFTLLKETKPDEMRKLVAVQGDTSEIGLGLSSESIALMRNVSVVIHSAATINFCEALNKAIRINVRGTLEALKFAENLSNLATFVHISTLYSNTNLNVLEEKLYTPPADWKLCLKLAESADDDLLEIFTNKIIGEFPNTYAFTKNLAEQVVGEYSKKIPVAIVRPAVVMNALVDPYVGYVSSVSGSMGVAAIGGTGLIRTIPFRRDLYLCQICLESVVRFAIIIVWKIATEGQPPDQVFISNIPGYYFSELTAIKQFNDMKQTWSKYPYEKMFWKPAVTPVHCKYHYNFRVLAYQVPPAVLIDLGLRALGRKPFALKIQRYSYDSFDKFSFFLNYNIECFSPHSDELIRHSHDFPGFDMNDIIYKSNEQYVESVLIGCRKFLLNESDETLPKARKMYIFFDYLDMAARWSLYYVVGKFAYNKLSDMFDI